MDETIELTRKQQTRDQLAKLLLGTATAFIATKLVENAYDRVMVIRRHNAALTNDD